MIKKLAELKNKLCRKIIRKAANYLDYYIETKSLPLNTYSAELVKSEQQKLFKLYQEQNIKNFPGIVCPYLLTLLKLLYANNSFNFLDFGARNIDNYSYLNSHLPKINYYYHDLTQYNSIISEIKKENSIQNLFIIDDPSFIKNNSIDFVFMGSVIQYIKDYKNILKLIFYSNPAYIFLSGTTFYENKSSDSEIVPFAQLNVLPQENYGMFFHFDSFKSFFEANDYILLSVEEAKYDHFINYNRINKNLGSINNLNVIFKKNNS
jgi:hypothetical protein